MFTQCYAICIRLGIALETIDAEDCPTREAAIAWIVANQLRRWNLTPSQKGPLGMELEKQLAIEAKKRQRLNNANRAILPDSEKGKASEQAAKMLEINPHYITDAKKIEQDAPELLAQVTQGTLSIPKP
jgi:aminoglycoside phosphotransferase